MNREDKILLAHGSGGKMTHDLIKNLFLQKFDNPSLATLTDSAILQVDGTKVAFTTDSYVVKPLFFPGGDIGKLAVCGTINDLAVMGARPICISCALVIEEGLDYKILERIVDSMEKTARDAGVKIVAGDTKVVAKGEGDAIFINTSGIGSIEIDFSLPADIEVGDRIILNGQVGEHGIAVLSARADLGLEAEIESDCACLNDLISGILSVSDRIKFMRDPTRGGLATTLNEIVEGRDYGIAIEEARIPVSDPVKGTCELLGFDPLYIANEGKVVVVVGEENAPQVMDQMRRHRLGRDAQVIGWVVSQPRGMVYLKTLAGGRRIVDMMVGDQLPRIC